MDAGSTVFVVRLPVHEAGRRLHHHEGAVGLHRAEHRMHEAALDHGPAVGNLRPVHFRIIVPRNIVDEFLHVIVVVVVEELHEVRRYGHVGLYRVQRVDFEAHEVRGEKGLKAAPVHVHAEQGRLPVGVGRLNLRKIVEAVGPEAGPPGLVQFFDIIMIAPAQPFLPGIFAMPAVAVAPQLVADVPHQKPRMVGEALSQGRVDCSHPVAEGGRRHAVIVPQSVVVPDPALVAAHGLGVFLVQPRRPRPGGCRENNVNSVLIQPVHDLGQPVQLEIVFRRLFRRPGKYAERHAVDSCFLEVFDVLFEYVRPVQPLVRIVVAAVH